MAVMASATVEFNGNVTKLTNALNKASKATSKWSKSTKKQTDLVKKAFAGIAGALAIRSVVNGFKSMVDNVDSLTKKARSLNIELDQWQKLRFIGELGGINPEALAKSISKLDANISRARSGIKTYADAFKLANVDVNEFSQNTDSVDRFLTFIDALQQIENTADKTRVQLELLGQAGVATSNINIDQARKDIELYEKLGLGYSKEVGTAAEKIADQMLVFTRIVDRIKVSAITIVAPQLEKVYNKFIEWVQNQGGATQAGIKIWEDIRDNTAKMASILLNIYTVAGNLATSIRVTLTALTGYGFLKNLKGQFGVVQGIKNLFNSFKNHKAPEGLRAFMPPGKVSIVQHGDEFWVDKRYLSGTRVDSIGRNFLKALWNITKGLVHITKVLITTGSGWGFILTALTTLAWLVPPVSKALKGFVESLIESTGKLFGTDNAKKLKAAEEFNKSLKRGAGIEDLPRLIKESEQRTMDRLFGKDSGTVVQDQKTDAEDKRLQDIIDKEKKLVEELAKLTEALKGNTDAILESIKDKENPLDLENFTGRRQGAIEQYRRYIDAYNAATNDRDRARFLKILDTFRQTFAGDKQLSEIFANDLNELLKKAETPVGEFQTVMDKIIEKLKTLLDVTPDKNTVTVKDVYGSKNRMAPNSKEPHSGNYFFNNDIYWEEIVAERERIRDMYKEELQIRYEAWQRELQKYRTWSTRMYETDNTIGLNPKQEYTIILKAPDDKVALVRGDKENADRLRLFMETWFGETASSVPNPVQ